MRRILGTAAIIGFSLACGGLFEEQQHALDAGDHRVLIDVRDLEPHFEGLVVDPDAEVWRKVKNFGEWELEYTYESEDGVFISSTVFFEESVSDAGTVMWGVNLMASMLESEGVEYVTAKDLLTVGDERECGYIKGEGEVMGNFCVVRGGSVVYVFTLAGAAFEGPGALDELLGPALTAAKSHTLKEMPIEKESP